MKLTDEDESSISSPELETLNISNDQYYQPVPSFKLQFKDLDEKLDIPKYGSSSIQHSLPAYDLWRPLFPTYPSEEKIRLLHCPKLRHYNTGPQARFRRLKAFPIKNLSRTIYKYQKKLRYKVMRAINEGMTRDEIVDKILLIHNARDLTVKQGELFLFEYSEQHPPVLSQIGMAANVKTFKKSSDLTKSPYVVPSGKILAPPLNDMFPGNMNNTGAQQHGLSQKEVKKCHKNTEPLGNYKIGYEEVISNKTTTKQIYYNQLKPGAYLRVIENNMFRAPIYDHKVPSCDFLIVRTRNSFYIRTVQTIFTVGQTMPLVAIPQPTENSIQKFRLDLSNNIIHRLFKESDTEPPTINFDLLLKLFPDYHESVLKRRLLSNGAVYERIGSQKIFLKGDSKYGLISLKELRRSFTPEQYCLNMAMLAARQRLRELNYTESMINPPNDAELETEILAAPWNTSKAVLSALSGRSYLDLEKHLIDPSGSQHEGFSCVNWPKSPTEIEQLKMQQISGNMLKALAQPATFLDKNPLLYQIKKEKLERLAIFQREAQIISKVQSEVLSSREVLSSEEDEEDDLEEENLLDTSFDNQLRDLDKLVLDGRNMNEVNFDKEEEIRHKMLRDFSQSKRIGCKIDEQKSSVKSNCSINVAAFKNKILRITRTYKSPDGDIQRTEIVREPKIIALYIKQKGGDVNCSQSFESKNDISKDDKHYFDCASTSCSGSSPVSRNNRSRSFTLGIGELCRADGIVLTISKSVLNTRAMRNLRRNSKVTNDDK